MYKQQLINTVGTFVMALLFVQCVGGSSEEGMTEADWERLNDKQEIRAKLTSLQGYLDEKINKMETSQPPLGTTQTQHDSAINQLKGYQEELGSAIIRLETDDVKEYQKAERQAKALIKEVSNAARRKGYTL
jgi:hypothetical protein